MRKVYTLPALTADGQDTSIGISADDAKLRSWLYDVKRHHIVTPCFNFHWSQDPRDRVFSLLGSFYVAHRMDGIYIKLNLCYEDYYRDALYPLDDLYSMLFKSERPSFCLCVTVTVQ
jgi:hypothetical protein